MKPIDADLDRLLRERFAITHADLMSALLALPATQPWAARLTENDAELLDSVGLVDDLEASAGVTASTAVMLAQLYSNAYSATDVAHGLRVNNSRVRQRRLDFTLWALRDDDRWVFPALQFDRLDDRFDGQFTLRGVRGLKQVFPQLLPRKWHPAAVARFLVEPQTELAIDNQPTSVRDWLVHGEELEPVLDLIDVADWAAR